MNEAPKRHIDKGTSQRRRRRVCSNRSRRSQLHETQAQILARLLNEIVPDNDHGQKRTFFEVIILRLWHATLSEKGNAMKVWNKYQKLVPSFQARKLVVKFEGDDGALDTPENVS